MFIDRHIIALIGRKVPSSLELFDACRERVENTGVKVNAMTASATKSLTNFVPVALEAHA